jgi:hypothetical protein
MGETAHAELAKSKKPKPSSTRMARNRSKHSQYDEFLPGGARSASKAVSLAFALEI